MESTSPISYMDFEPYCAWHREEEADTLAVHLYGFRREQMRVQVNSQRIVTIHGQRPLDETRWSRFTKQIKLPDNCIEDGIRAKFAGGILTITMTKSKRSSPSPSPSSSCPRSRSCTREEDKKCNLVKDRSIKEKGIDNDKKKWVSGILMLKIAALVFVLAVSSAYVNCVWKLRSCSHS